MATSLLVRGGSNYVEVFDLVTTASPWTLATEFVFQQNVTIDVARQADSTYKITMDSTLDDETLTTFFDDWLPEEGTSTEAPESYTYEDGSQETGSASSDVDKLMYMIIYGAENSAGTKLKVWEGVVALDPTSSSYKQEFNKSTKPILIFTSVKAAVAVAPIAGNYETDLLATVTPTNLPLGSFGRVKWYTKAS